MVKIEIGQMEKGVDRLGSSPATYPAWLLDIADREFVRTFRPVGSGSATTSHAARLARCAGRGM
jgi:hypothetical protein